MPARYAIANLLYRTRFPSGCLSATDFRPDFDGYLLNACVILPVGLNPRAVEEASFRRLEQTCRWMRTLRFLLRPGDRVQFCIGTRRPPTQTLKAWCSRADLAAGVLPRDVTSYFRADDAKPPREKPPRE